MATKKIVSASQNAKLLSSWAANNKGKSFTADEIQQNFIEFAAFTGLNLDPNEFLVDMVNLIAESKTYSIFNFTSPYDVYLQYRERENFGDNQLFTVTDNLTTKDFSAVKTDNSPFNAQKPKTHTTPVGTTQKKFWDLQISGNIYKGATLSLAGYTELTNVILGQLNSTFQAYIYDYISSVINQDYTSNTTNGFVDVWAEDLVTNYDETKINMQIEAVQILEDLMTFPETKYNKIGFKNATPYNENRVIMNIKTKNSFQAESIATQGTGIININTFNTPIILNDNVAVKTVKFLPIKAYVYNYRIESIESIYNPADMATNIFMHRWIRDGLIEGVNMVTLHLEAKVVTP